MSRPAERAKIDRAALERNALEWTCEALLLGGRHPVFHAQPRNALEFREVVRDQNQAQGTCVASNHQVEGAYRSSVGGEFRAQLSAVRGGASIVVQHFQASNEALDDPQIPLW